MQVSIIIPLYKSQQVLPGQVKTWQADGINYELIYVDDNCPNNSGAIAQSLWHLRQDHEPRFLKTPENLGFAGACNEGASLANGEYLLFLNADTETPYANWLATMVAHLDHNPRTGIVGNTQVHPDMTIDSCGSQWVWHNKHLGHFAHLGRDYYGKELFKPYTLDNCPPHLLESGTREMVTGCCLMIRRELYEDLGGFDTAYKIGYWEDADLNLKVRERGYDVWYEGQSVIVHHGYHSGAAGHKFKQHNRNVFRERWIDTGKIDSMVSNERPGV